MKYIITEGQNEKLIIKYLNNEYGDLEEYTREKNPNSVYLVKDKKVYMEYELKSGDLWVDYRTIWIDLKNIFGLKDSEIEHIITKWVEETYKLRDVTPCSLNLDFCWLVENTYKITI